MACCVEADSGEMVYESGSPVAGSSTPRRCWRTGKIYAVGPGGRTFVLAAKPQFEQLAVNDLADRGVFNAGPVVDGNRLLIRSDKFLYCVGASWSFTAQALTALSS